MESVERMARMYMEITSRALQMVEVAVPEGTELEKIAKLLVDMAERYLSDARYFFERGDYGRALASVSYAHAWIDVGVVLGILKGEDPNIFMVEP